MPKRVIEREGAGRKESSAAPNQNQATSSIGERKISMHTITGGGDLQLAVHEYGRPDGKPILFIHGINQSHLVWSRQYQSALAEEFRLVFLDNRGHGMSEKPTASDHYTQAQLWADDVQAVISELELQKPILVGWSYGGFIVNDYLAKYGEANVGGINYVCAAVMLGVEKAAGTIGSGFHDNIAGLCSEKLTDNIQAVCAFLRSFFVKRPPPDAFETLLAFNMVVPPAVRLGLVSRVIDRDDIMRGLTVPVLVTQGEKDKLVLTTHTTHLLSCIPHALASVYADAGHVPFLEDPERFNQELATFARQNTR
jgi:non-heme chloroperoxidase